MAYTEAQQKKSYQPIPRFYRPNPRLFVCLSIVLKPIEFSILLELIAKMDLDNSFEVEAASVSQYIQDRFKIRKSHANSHLKRLSDLQLIIFIQGKTRSACRINPIIANRCQFLAGLWEFEGLELESEKILSLYSDWAIAKGLDEFHDLPKVLSMQRLNAVIASKRKKKTDEEVTETKALQEQINRMMEEHCQDTENWLKAREDLEMQVQVLKEELRVGREKFEEEIRMSREQSERAIKEQREQGLLRLKALKDELRKGFDRSRLELQDELRVEREKSDEVIRDGREKFDEQLRLHREKQAELAEQAEKARQEFQEQLRKSREELHEVRDILLELARRFNIPAADAKEIKRHLELVRT